MAGYKKSHSSRDIRARLLARVMIGTGLLVVGLVTLSLLIRASGSASSRTESTVIPAQVNFLAPEVKLSDLQGNPVSLSDFQGQVLLVNNWATWCPPCKAEMPTLQAYYEAHREAGFTIVAIEAGEPVEEVAKFVEDYGLGFPVWPDTDQAAVSAFRNLSLPNSYVIDRSGNVRLAWNGAVTRSVLEKYVTPLLED